MARAYDIKAVVLYSCKDKLNFPIGTRNVPTPVKIDHQVVSRREVMENQEVFEQLEAARADDKYIANFRRMHLEIVAEERRLLDLYQKSVHDVDEARPSGRRGSEVEVIDLSSN